MQDRKPLCNVARIHACEKLLRLQEMINFLTPGGGGLRGVNVERRRTAGVFPRTNRMILILIMMITPLLSTVCRKPHDAARTFEHANGLATTLQRDRLQFYIFENHSAATFRVRKALVPESMLFAAAPNVSKDLLSGHASFTCHDSMTSVCHQSQDSEHAETVRPAAPTSLLRRAGEEVPLLVGRGVVAGSGMQ